MEIGRIGRYTLAALFSAFVGVSAAQDAKTVLADASKALGVDTLNTVEFSATGFDFVLGQAYEYLDLIRQQDVTLSSSNYGSVFFLTTGFHGLHVTGGLFAFVFLLGRTYAAKRFTREQQISAIVVSYYWHFVDVVWIGLFTTIYLIH